MTDIADQSVFPPASISEIVSSLSRRCRHYQFKSNKGNSLLGHRSITGGDDDNDYNHMTPLQDNNSVTIVNNNNFITDQSNETTLEGQLISLEVGYRKLVALAPKYDLSDNCIGNGSTGHNGIRSLTKIILSLLKLLEEKIVWKGHKMTNEKACRLITDTTFVINEIISMVILLEEKRVSTGGDAHDLLSSSSDLDYMIVERLLSLSSQGISSEGVKSVTNYSLIGGKQVSPLKTFYSLNSFWLARSLSFYHSFFLKMLIAGTSVVYQGKDNVQSNLRGKKSPNFLKLVSLLSTKRMKEEYIGFCTQTNVKNLKRAWSFTGKPFMTPFLSLDNSFGPRRVKRLSLPRQGRIRIVDSRTVIIRNEKSDYHNELNHGNRSTEKSSSSVSCLLLQDSSSSQQNQSLVLHLHGGGYVSMNTRSHEIYLRKWARKIEGVPILSVEYTLAPGKEGEGEFPTALQECLDVYLFITNRNHSNRDSICSIDTIIGFQPRNIVLVGDSAGSNLSLCLLHVINEVNRQLVERGGEVSHSNQVPLPSALFLPYPHTNPSIVRMTPSRLLMAIDPVLSTGVMFSLSEGYHPESRSVSMCLPWYRQSLSFVRRRLEEMEGEDMDLFFNPLVGLTNGHSASPLKNISLFVVVGEFDPLLDEAISLVRKWPGKKRLDILPKLTHGFLFCGLFSKDSRKGVDFCSERLKEAIGLHQRPTSNEDLRWCDMNRKK